MKLKPPFSIRNILIIVGILCLVFPGIWLSRKPIQAALFNLTGEEAVFQSVTS
jgi:hypothetical protein